MLQAHFYKVCIDSLFTGNRVLYLLPYSHTLKRLNADNLFSHVSYHLISILIIMFVVTEVVHTMWLPLLLAQG